MDGGTAAMGGGTAVTGGGTAVTGGGTSVNCCVATTNLDRCQTTVCVRVAGNGDGAGRPGATNVGTSAL